VTSCRSRPSARSKCRRTVLSLLDVSLDHAGVPDGIDLAWQPKHYLGAPVPGATVATVNLAHVVAAVEFTAEETVEQPPDATVLTGADVEPQSVHSPKLSSVPTKCPGHPDATGAGSRYACTPAAAVARHHAGDPRPVLPAATRSWYRNNQSRRSASHTCVTLRFTTSTGRFLRVAVAQFPVL
jgi:hypothetical protein